MRRPAAPAPGESGAGSPPRLQRLGTLIFQAMRVGLALGLLGWLLVAFGEELPAYVAGANPLLILAAAAVILWNIVLRGWRWRILFVTRPELWPAVASTAASYLLNNVLPGRPGDLLRVFMLGSLSGISRGRVFATVVFERVIDLLFASVLLVVLTRFKAVPAWLDYGAVVVGCGAVGGLVAMIGFALLWNKRRQLPLLARIAGYLPGSLRELVARVSSSFAQGTVDLARPGPLLYFLVLTAILWTTEGLVAHLVILALGHTIPFTDTLVILVVAAFSSFLPTVPGQLGVFEAAVVAAASALSFGEGALATAVVLHGLVLIVTSGFGLVSLIVERRRLGSPAKWLSPRSYSNIQLPRTLDR